MKTLYIDNFRGFFDTKIPLKDVNFLVGENSTGKTSILSLLQVLSSAEFWRTGDFNTHNLGNKSFSGLFEDIVSNPDDEDAVFRVGMIEEDGAGKVVDFFLMSFENKDGLPFLKAYSFINKSKLKHAYITSLPADEGGNIYDTDSDLPLSLEDILSISLATYISLGKSDYRELQYTFSGKLQPFSAWGCVSMLSECSNDPILRIKYCPESFVPFIWFAPIREEPKATYDQYKRTYSSAGSHIPYILNDILNGKDQSASQDLQKTLAQFGLDSGLFQKIDVKRYGEKNTDPFAVQITINNRPLKISNVGYGVSQVLPILIECFISEAKTTFAIQQPEVHLHPKAQASLGAFIHSLAKEENKKFFIETHSDFLIDRFRQKFKGENGLTAQVLFFEQTETGNRVTPIAIKNNGAYDVIIQETPSFQDFFIKEAIANMHIGEDE